MNAESSVGLSLSAKQELVESLQSFVPKYSDAKIRTELDLANWDVETALAKMMQQLHDEKVSANQKRVTDTNALFSQARASCGS